MKTQVKHGNEKENEKKRENRFKIEAPLHPIFVHFTIALTASSLVFEVLGRLLSDDSLSHASFWTIAGAALITIATILSGAISAAKIPVEEGRARSYLRTHMALGFAFYGLLVVIAIWRLSFWESRSTISLWYLAALVFVTLVMALQGYLGGELVYRFGLEVHKIYRKLPVETKSEPAPSTFLTKESEEEKK